VIRDRVYLLALLRADIAHEALLLDLACTARVERAGGADELLALLDDLEAR